MYVKDRGKICPIYDTFNLFNRKWVIAITMDLFNGCTHFYDFKNNNPGLSNHILSKTLQFMELNGIIYKKVYEDRRESSEYYLTEKGKKLNTIMYDMLLYSLYELNFSSLNDEKKKELKNNYKKSLNIKEDECC